MVKKLSKKELFNLIKEAVTKKVNLLREDIDVDDDEIWDYYDDDNSGDDWLSSYGKMPKGYDDDVTDVDTLDRMAQMNNNLPVDRIGSPALKRAEMNASWAASDREDRDNADRLNSQYEDNYYDDSNENSDPDSSAWHSDSYNKNLKFGLKDWNKNTPNEDTRYYERLETDPLDGDVLDLSANESRVYESIKKMIEAKIRKNPSAFGLRENDRKGDSLSRAYRNGAMDGEKKFMKEEVDMGQIPAVSDRRSTAKEYSPEVKKEIRKLRYMIDDYEKEGKDTSELTKRIQKLKRQ